MSFREKLSVHIYIFHERLLVYIYIFHEKLSVHIYIFHEKILTDIYIALGEGYKIARNGKYRPTFEYINQLTYLHGKL